MKPLWGWCPSSSGQWRHISHSLNSRFLLKYSCRSSSLKLPNRRVCLSLFLVYITSQVCSCGHPVPDCWKDCGDEESGRGGWPAWDVHRLCHCGSPYPWPLCPATTLLPSDQEESLQLHWWHTAGAHHSSGDLIQVSVILCPVQILMLINVCVPFSVFWGYVSWKECNILYCSLDSVVLILIQTTMSKEIQIKWNDTLQVTL